MFTKLIIAALFYAILIDGAFAQVTWKNNRLTVENDQMVQVLSFQDSRITPVSVYSKKMNAELLSQEGLPWFEFVISGNLLKSDDPVWKYKSHEVRHLNNGGEEVRISVEAIQKVKGLRLEIYRQYFPGSTLLRERIILKTGNHSFSLNKLDGKLHFVFPQYSLRSGDESISSEEIRIASFAEEVLGTYDKNLTYDDRKLDKTGDINLAYCHMFHPKINALFLQNGDTSLFKGPFSIVKTSEFTWMSTYEHASQDKNFGTEHAQAKAKNQSGGMANDQQQGVEGKSGLVASDSDFWFLGLKSIKLNGSLVVSLNQLRGGYLDGEKIEQLHPYETVWSTTSFYRDPKEVQPAIHRYLWNQITENRASRQSHYYYNTWGMQRDVNNKTGLRDIFTESRIMEEIRNAAELKVDLFVLDDGWEQAMGDWQPNKTRLPNGLKPLIDEMNKHHIIPGAWLSPMGIDSLAERYKRHPEWVIRDETGAPIKAQWGFPAFDFVSGFYDLFVADCKKLVDQGIRFFKWDAINTFDSTLPELNHGSSKYSKQEIRDRYAFLLPFYVTRAMRELREYQSDVTVEIDLTEKERCIIGLMPLQEGKLFWMNNGASAYNDYSTYRTKSMRTVINSYAGIIPTELFTQAVYPQNVSPFFARHYNVNTTMIAGRGFWGNLKMMTAEQRLRAGRLVEKSKRVLPYIKDLPLAVSGSIGSSPEVYTHVNSEAAAGQVIAFSGSAIESPLSIDINTINCLGILNHAFSMGQGKLNLPFQFNRPDDTREAFILPNSGSGIGIESATCWMEDIQLDMANKLLTVIPGNQGSLLVRFPTGISGIKCNEKMLVPEKGGSESVFNYFRIRVMDLDPLNIQW